MTDQPGTARVQCDTCNGVHHVQIPIAPDQSARDALNVFLVGLGWETYEQRSDGQQRHRCVACVQLRDALAGAEARYARLDALFQDYRMKDGHS